MAGKRTAIVTGASQGIGAAVVQAFLDRGYNVVATSRGISKANFAPSPHLALVDGDIGQAATADNVAQTAIGKFGLPRRSRRDRSVADAHGPHPGCEDMSVGTVIVAYQVGRRRCPGEGLGDLSGQPLGRRMSCYLEPQQLPPAVT